MSKTGNFPAYPVQDGPQTFPGLTKREWFAGQALAGLLANADFIVAIKKVAADEGIAATKVIAMNCWSHADTMIAEGERRGG